MIIKNCLYCNNSFFTTNARIKKGNGKFCTRNCFNKSQRLRIKRECKICNKNFEIKISYAKKGFGKFCSAKCYFQSEEVKVGGKTSKGRIKSKETIEKIKAGRKGKRTLPIGYHHSLKTRMKISQGRCGEKSWCWKGGLRSLTQKCYESSRYKDWRKQIFIRDQYICQTCGKKGGKLNADHIKPRSVIVREFLFNFPNLITVTEKFQALVDCKELWDINNGRTLCLDCHRLTDTYGKQALNKQNGNSYD